MTRQGGKELALDVFLCFFAFFVGTSWFIALLFLFLRSKKPFGSSLCKDCFKSFSRSVMMLITFPMSASDCFWAGIGLGTNWASLSTDSVVRGLLFSFETLVSSMGLFNGLWFGRRHFYN